MGSFRGFTFLLLLLSVVVSVNAGAITKRIVSDFRVIQATAQRMIPGIPGAPIRTEYIITLVWVAKQKPAAFYWKDESGWKNCIGSKPLENLTKGDTLIISSMRGNVQQAGLPKAARNTLCYKTRSSGWRLVPVRAIIQKTDSAAP